MATIRDIVIRLSGDSRGIRKATEQSAKSLKSLAAKAERAGKRITGAFKRAAGALALYFGARAIKNATQAAFEFGDRMAKTADKIGLTTDALQEMRFAAELAGVNQQTLDMAMQRFVRRLGEAAQGQGELKGTLELYGIAVRNSSGQTRAAVEVLGDLANVMRDAESDGERLRVAFKAFDSEGAALVNMLKHGAEAFDAVRQKARDLGLILGEDLLRQAEASTDKLTILSGVLKIKMTNAILNLAPQIDSVVEKLTAWSMEVDLVGWATKTIEKFQSLNKYFKQFAGGLAFAANIVVYSVEVFSDAEKALARFQKRSEEIRKQYATPIEPPKKKLHIIDVYPPTAPPAIPAPTFEPLRGFLPPKPVEMETMWSAIKTKTEEWAADTGTIQENVASGFIAMTTQISDGFGAAMGRMIVYGESFADSFGSVLKSLAAQTVSILSQIALGGLFTAVGLPGVGSALSLGVFHQGGPIRGLNLASDEVPIIAQTGERVMSREDNSELMGMLEEALGSRSQTTTVQLDDEQGNRLMSWIVNKTSEGRGNGVRQLVLL